MHHPVLQIKGTLGPDSTLEVGDRGSQAEGVGGWGGVAKQVEEGDGVVVGEDVRASDGILVAVLRTELWQRTTGASATSTPAATARVTSIRAIKVGGGGE